MARWDRKNFSEDVIKLTDLLCPEDGVRHNSTAHHKNMKEVVDNNSYSEVLMVVNWLKTNSFYSNLIYSPAMLKKHYRMILEDINAAKRR